LRVEFRADGSVGEIQPLGKLPDGLTEKAVEAAKLIKFQPEMRGSQPVSKTLEIIYDFRL